MRLLTQSKGVSFVTLWGGRPVDYYAPLGEDDSKRSAEMLFTQEILPTPIGFQMPSKKVLNLLKTPQST